MRRSRLILVAVPLLLAGGYYGLWSWGADRLNDRLDDRVASLQAQGGDYRAANRSTTGFPLGYRLETQNLALRTPDGVAVRSDHIVAEADVWALTDIALSFDQGLLVSVPTGGDNAPPIRLASATGTGLISAGSGSGVEASTLTLNSVSVNAPGADLVQIDSLDVAFTPPPAPAAPIVLAITARDITAPALPAGLMGGAIESASLEAAATTPLPADMNAAALALWRDHGGSITIERFALDWGSVSIVASGTITLDRDLQPRAELMTEIRGFQQGLAAAQQAGLIPVAQAMLVGVGLATFAGPPDADGVSTLRAPLTVDNRQVSLAGVRLPVRVPRIDWPNPPGY